LQITAYEGLLLGSAQKEETMLSEIQYNENPSNPLHLDFYPGATTTVPLVVWIHGGAWMAGSRHKTPTGFLQQDGYAVASISYRLTDKAIFPAQIHDCKCAIRFLRANAESLGFDSRRIGTWGASAGGHLAAMLALTGGNVELEGAEGYPQQTSDVQATCDWFGPSDLINMPYQESEMDHAGADSPEGRLVGGVISDRSELAKMASPINHVSAAAAPMLIVHGTADPLVPYAQSTSLCQAMEKAGASVEMITYEGSGHGDGRFTQASAFDDVRGFFHRQLPIV
jgi:acetyl esterase/lipase